MIVMYNVENKSIKTYNAMEGKWTYFLVTTYRESTILSLHTM